jgi:hypothetical protein
MNVVELRPKDRRISTDELAMLRLSAEINALLDSATKADRDLVLALVELQQRRQEEKW